jgi:exopolysaccharide production protein ExoY
MSLVGPRPLVPEEDALIEGLHRCRLLVRPGMTGPWQVAGASRIPIAEMVRLDSDYVSAWSPWRDLKLIVGTVPHVLRRRGL